MSVVSTPIETPILDDIESELASTGEGVAAALELVADQELQAAGRELVIAYTFCFLKAPARGFALHLFDASRREGVVTELAALQTSLGLVDEQLRRAAKACRAGSQEGADQALSEVTAVLHKAEGLVGELRTGPLGQRIRLLHLEGYLDC